MMLAFKGLLIAAATGIVGIVGRHVYMWVEEKIEEWKTERRRNRK